MKNLTDKSRKWKERPDGSEQLKRISIGESEAAETGIHVEWTPSDYLCVDQILYALTLSTLISHFDFENHKNCQPEFENFPTDIQNDTALDI